MLTASFIAFLLIASVLLGAIYWQNRNIRKALKKIAREQYRDRYGQFICMTPNPGEIKEFRELEKLWND